MVQPEHWGNRIQEQGGSGTRKAMESLPGGKKKKKKKKKALLLTGAGPHFRVLKTV
jgi:hypothetical protein